MEVSTNVIMTIEVDRELRGQMEEAVFQILYDSLAFVKLRQNNAEKSRAIDPGSVGPNSRSAACIACQQMDATASREGA